jgi:hypothetical protein
MVKKNEKKGSNTSDKVNASSTKEEQFILDDMFNLTVMPEPKMKGVKNIKNSYIKSKTKKCNTT